MKFSHSNLKLMLGCFPKSGESKLVTKKNSVFRLLFSKALAANFRQAIYESVVNKSIPYLLRVLTNTHNILW